MYGSLGSGLHTGKECCLACVCKVLRLSQGGYGIPRKKPFKTSWPPSTNMWTVRVTQTCQARMWKWWRAKNTILGPG